MLVTWIDMRQQWHDDAPYYEKRISVFGSSPRLDLNTNFRKKITSVEISHKPNKIPKRSYIVRQEHDVSTTYGSKQNVLILPTQSEPLDHKTGKLIFSVKKCQHELHLAQRRLFFHMQTKCPQFTEKELQQMEESTDRISTSRIPDLYDDLPFSHED